MSSLTTHRKCWKTCRSVSTDVSAVFHATSRHLTTRNLSTRTPSRRAGMRPPCSLLEPTALAPEQDAAKSGSEDARSYGLHHLSAKASKRTSARSSSAWSGSISPKHPACTRSSTKTLLRWATAVRRTWQRSSRVTTPPCWTRRRKILNATAERNALWMGNVEPRTWYMKQQWEPLTARRNTSGWQPVSSKLDTLHTRRACGMNAMPTRRSCQSIFGNCRTSRRSTACHGQSWSGHARTAMLVNGVTSVSPKPITYSTLTRTWRWTREVNWCLHVDTKKSSPSLSALWPK